MSKRVVSLIASATEIVCALGFEDALVGRSHECDFPESVTRLPCCTRPRFDVGASSAEIDRAVKSLVSGGLSVYHVEEEMLRSLEPDVIVTQSQCEVCAVSLRDVERAVCAWLGKCPALVSLQPDSLADVWADLERVALALDAWDRGDDLAKRLKRRMASIADSVPAERPRVACIEWCAPLMAAGNWVPELVALAGGIDLFGTPGKHAPWLEWDALRAADPDVIVLMPCGYGLERTRAEVPLLQALPGWGDLEAVRTGRVAVTDGNRFFNRPGPRLAESLEILAEILHPARFRFGHEGRAWIRS
ncbi:MAG: cobalamin-binding protein [Gemmataceae bacterium]|nr:cobalamin-binding protein [Gemmataceae bacterium]